MYRNKCIELLITAVTMFRKEFIKNFNVLQIDDHNKLKTGKCIMFYEKVSSKFKNENII